MFRSGPNFEACNTLTKSDGCIICNGKKVGGEFETEKSPPLGGSCPVDDPLNYSYEVNCSSAGKTQSGLYDSAPDGRQCCIEKERKEGLDPKNSCEWDPDRNGGEQIFFCQASSTCASPLTKYSGDYDSCLVSGVAGTCCYNKAKYDERKESKVGTGSTGSCPGQCSLERPTKASATCSSGEWHYDETDLAKAKELDSYCGGGYCWQCVGSTKSTTTVTPTPTTLPASKDPCATKGGSIPGAPTQLCDGKAYDNDEAAKPKGASHPYCGKKYELEYTCANGDKEKIVPTGPNVCEYDPWCPDGTPTTGTGEDCDGAPNAASNKKCPANKPLCNKPGGTITPECVASRSQTDGKFCSGNEVCVSNLCKPEAGLPSKCAENPSGAPPTATPTPIGTPSDSCPVVDPSDGRPNTCYGSSDKAQAAIDIPGYSLKSTDPNALPNLSCSQHTSGKNPWCWHKDAPSAATPTPATTLGADCPNIDADGKPNSCADKNDCPLGYEHKTPNNGGDAMCTGFRGAESWCCHKK